MPLPPEADFDAVMKSLLAETEALMDRGAYGPAARRLRSFLRDHDPATAPPDSWVMIVAMFYAQCVDNTDDDDSGQRWAWYALRTALLLDGQDGEAAGLAATVFASVLEEHGDTRPAIILREVVAARHHQASRYLHHVDARLMLAEALHADGSCGAAIREATTALDAYSAGQHDTKPDVDGARYLIKTLRMLDLCGRTDEALALLAQWRPRLPNAEPGRSDTVLLARLQLGGFIEAQTHQPRCAARLGDRLGLAADRPRICTQARRAEVRRAFLDALGEPDHDGTPDRPSCRCQHAPPPARRRRSVLDPTLDALIRILIQVRLHRALRQARRGVRADAASQQTAHSRS